MAFDATAGPARATRRAIESIMAEYARQKRTITYKALILALPANPLELKFEDPRLNDMLTQISRETDSRGDGLLSAVVVNGYENLPGVGFFELAKELGRRGSDDVVWLQELKHVYDRYHDTVIPL